MVGDGGLEPPTSTMSTWRSTPELIALGPNKSSRRSEFDLKRSACRIGSDPAWGTRKILKRIVDCNTPAPISAGFFGADAVREIAHALDFVAQSRRLLELEVSRCFEHLFLQLHGLL